MTPRRYRRLVEVLSQRQPDLTVVLDNVHKGHNFAAVLRTCDAVGLLEAHAVLKPLPRRSGKVRTTRMPSAGAGKWVRVHTHESGPAAIAALQARGFALWAAHLSADAVDYREVDFARPTAVLLGQEKFGVTDEVASLCDGRLVIPMHGMVQSLNVSVANAVVLYEARRQREAAGLYDAPRLDREAFRRTLFEWAYPRFAERLRREGREYPELGEDGALPPEVAEHLRRSSGEADA